MYSEHEPGNYPEATKKYGLVFCDMALVSLVSFSQNLFKRCLTCLLPSLFNCTTPTLACLQHSMMLATTVMQSEKRESANLAMMWRLKCGSKSKFMLITPDNQHKNKIAVMATITPAETMNLRVWE